MTEAPHPAAAPRGNLAGAVAADLVGMDRRTMTIVAHHKHVPKVGGTTRHQPAQPRHPCRLRPLLRSPAERRLKDDT